MENKMQRPISLIIADDEPFICSMLQKLIRFDALNIQLLGLAHDGISLEKMIDQLHPDVVLTDISMPKEDGLNVIRYARERGIDCRFIIISGYRQFEYAYNALKYNVDDYLLKPVNENELNAILQKICHELRSAAALEEAEAESKERTLVMWLSSPESRNTTKTLEEINRKYGTGFARGTFCAFFLKLDFTWDASQYTENVSSVTEKLRRLVVEVLGRECTDTAVIINHDGLMAVANYTVDEQVFRKLLLELYTEAKNITELFQGFNMTLCVGTPVGSLGQVYDSVEASWYAIWLRMYYGMNRMIFASSFQNNLEEKELQMLQTARSDVKRAITAFDMQGVEAGLAALFHMPANVMCSAPFMNHIYGIVNDFTEQYHQIVKNPDLDCREELVAQIHVQTSFHRVHEILRQSMAQYMQKLDAFTREKTVRPIAKACVYVENHYSERLSLERMAEIVDLNPVYFSTLFKKETGSNFSDYLTQFRIKKAKEFLREDSMNVNEIAEALGFSDARYFSKVFKKEVGVKPTDYRKIYG